MGSGVLFMYTFEVTFENPKYGHFPTPCLIPLGFVGGEGACMQ